MEREKFQEFSPSSASHSRKFEQDSERRNFFQKKRTGAQRRSQEISFDVCLPSIVLQSCRSRTFRCAATNSSTSIEPRVSLGTSLISMRCFPLSLYLPITHAANSNFVPLKPSVSTPQRTSKVARLIVPGNSSCSLFKEQKVQSKRSREKIPTKGGDWAATWGKNVPRSSTHL